MDYRSNCVKYLSVLSFILNLFPLFLRKKLYAIVWTTLETRTNFNKTKILNKYFAVYISSRAQLLMVQYLILALKADNVEACFILSGISFHSFGPKLDAVSLLQCPVCMFLLTKFIALLKL